MTYRARPQTSPSRPQAARPWYTAVRTYSRGLLASQRGLAWVWMLVAAAMSAAALHAPGAAGDVRTAFAHLSGPRLSWLGVALALEGLSLAAGASAQCQLLSAGGVRLPWRTVYVLVLASTGLARMMPAGPVTGGAWQVREYRRRGARAAAGLWAVLAAGFTSTAVILAMLLAGAAVAGAGSLLLLACAAVVLAAAVAGLTAAAHRARALSRWLSRCQHHSRYTWRLAAAVAGLTRQRARLGLGVGVLACTAAGLLADAGVLAACFGLAGLPVPRRGLLFAYAAGQLAARVVPLPGGLGAVEGGMLGALTLTGTPAAAAAAAVITYRAAGYWVTGTAGTVAAAALARHGSHAPGVKPPASQRGAMAKARRELPPGRHVRCAAEKQKPTSPCADEEPHASQNG